MFAWFIEALASLSREFSGTASSDSPVVDCWRPTVSIIGREKEYYDEVAVVRAFGHPWGEDGMYRWQVVSGSAMLSSRTDARIEVRRTSPGTVGLMVTYSIGGKTSEAAYHTIQFVAHPVYIVGGGAAGLKAAEHLLSNGFKVVLCEATGRLGGRARTVNAVRGDFKVDLGCQWLHKDEWQWEVTQKNIVNKGFRADNQRELYPQLEAVWPFPEDVTSVFLKAHGMVKAGLGSGYNQNAAATRVPAFADLAGYPPADMDAVYNTRRTAEVNRRLDALVALQHVAHVAAAHDYVQDPAVDARATSLAREEFIKVDRGQFRAEAQKNVKQKGLQGGKAINDEQTRLWNDAKAQKEVEFGQRGPNINRLIDEKKPAARAALEGERVAELDGQERNLRRQGAQQQFDLNHPRQNFLRLCELAYKIGRNMEGPLEEAAEWDQFSNIDREPGRLGPATEDGCDVVQSKQNSWCLDGYGGLIEKYGAYLKTRFGAKLWIRLNTAVTGIRYGDAEQTLTIRAGRHDTFERSSAVIVTVSTGVINGGGLTFTGAGAAQVTDAYAKLPMGNYKKVVLVFNSEVALRVAPPGASNPDTHCGTSVCWHLDDQERLWKFLVPDVNRRIVITIVGGALADALDAGDDVALQRTRAALIAAGVITNQALVVEQYISNWMTERAFLGAYSYTAVGGAGGRNALIAQPLLDSGVAFAGEALFVKYGTAHGAYITGLRAAKAVVGTLPRMGIDTAANMD